MKIEREFVSRLEKHLKTQPDWIQVVLGPRQVGKTYGVQQLFQRWKGPKLWVSADGELLRHRSWITEQWLKAMDIANDCLLVIDEIQKVELWSEEIKKLWDQRLQKGLKPRVVLLGSSAVQIQKGLSESLTGRFVLHRVFHWGYEESRKAFQLSWNEFLSMGGYPASYAFRKKKSEWLQYVQGSIVDTVIGKDILSLNRVKSPALFRQAFDLACSYAGQEISYTKLLGQLQDRGNTDLVKHYLEMFENAFLIKQLQKYSEKKVLTRSSSPKILPLCPALYSLTLDAQLSELEEGRAFEIIVGAELAQLPGELYYWREKNLEVDYVYRFGKSIYGIEVKRGGIEMTKGLYSFQERFPKAEILILTPENYERSIKALREQAEQ